MAPPTSSGMNLVDAPQCQYAYPILPYTVADRPRYAIDEHRDGLREAAERTLNAIVDLNLDCTVKWVSPSWVDVVGTSPDEISGRLFSELIVSDNKCVFQDVIKSMQREDSRSHRVRFAISIGPLSKLFSPIRSESSELGSSGLIADQERPLPVDTANNGSTSPIGESMNVIDLEAQGIMVYDNSSGQESHVCYTGRDIFCLSHRC
jgi:serine/threonine-protein kinase RIM15